MKRLGTIFLGIAAALSVGLTIAWVGLHNEFKLKFTQGGCELPPESNGSFIKVAGGGFTSGDHPLYPEEGPTQRVFVSTFLMQIHEVTNAQFSEFAKETGYLTDAEQRGGSARFDASRQSLGPLPWWVHDTQATWRTPEGHGSSIEGRETHPVVHVSLNDARAYAAWAKARLPSEVEWEYAASRGLSNPRNPTFGIEQASGKATSNIWTGVFPFINTAEDGFKNTSPVGCFPKSRIGTHDMIGNVWEWTESRSLENQGRYTIKGGSFLCAQNYCRRYRPAARQSIEQDYSASHIGFRVVKDVQR